jgi:hypothetical protein
MPKKKRSCKLNPIKKAFETEAQRLARDFEGSVRTQYPIKKESDIISILCLSWANSFLMLRGTHAEIARLKIMMDRKDKIISKLLYEKRSVSMELEKARIPSGIPKHWKGD